MKKEEIKTKYYKIEQLNKKFNCRTNEKTIKID